MYSDLHKIYIAALIDGWADRRCTCSIICKFVQFVGIKLQLMRVWKGLCETERDWNNGHNEVWSSIVWCSLPKMIIFGEYILVWLTWKISWIWKNGMKTWSILTKQNPFVFCCWCCMGCFYWQQTNVLNNTELNNNNIHIGIHCRLLYNGRI